MTCWQASERRGASCARRDSPKANAASHLPHRSYGQRRRAQKVAHGGERRRHPVAAPRGSGGPARSAGARSPRRGVRSRRSGERRASSGGGRRMDGRRGGPKISRQAVSKKRKAGRLLAVQPFGPQTIRAARRLYDPARALGPPRLAFGSNGVFPSLNLLQYIVVCLRPIHLASEREKTTRRTCLTSIGSSPMRLPACATWSACGGRRDSSARSARTRAKHGA